MKKLFSVCLVICLAFGMLTFSSVSATAPKIMVIATETETEVLVDVKLTGDIAALDLYSICVGYTTDKLAYKDGSGVIQTPPGWSLDAFSDNPVYGDTTARYVRLQNGFADMGVGGTIAVTGSEELLIGSFTLTKLSSGILASDIFQRAGGFKYGVPTSFVNYSRIKDGETEISMKDVQTLVEHTFTPLNAPEPLPEFSYSENGTSVIITGYNGQGGAVTLPLEIDGKAVIGIGDDAFKNKTSVTSIVIPLGVTSIGSEAFQGCTGLTTVTIPTSVTSIGDGAFSSVNSAFVIRGYEGSYAHTYAVANSITFFAIPVATGGFKSAILVPNNSVIYNDEGIIAFDLYGEKFSDLKVLLIEFKYDQSKLILLNTASDENVYVVEDDGDGNVIIIATLPQKISSEERIKLFTLRFKMKEASKGENVSVELSQFAGGTASGTGQEIVSEIDEEESEAVVEVIDFTFTYDVNGDGKVDLGDLVYAETFYGARMGDSNWTTAIKADSDGDNQITTADFINIAIYIATNR